MADLAVAGEEITDESAPLLLLVLLAVLLLPLRVPLQLSAEVGESLLLRLKLGAGRGRGNPPLNGVSRRSPACAAVGFPDGRCGGGGNRGTGSPCGKSAARW